MIYHLLNFDYNTGLGKAIEAPLYRGSLTPSGFIVNVFIDKNKCKPKEPEVAGFIPEEGMAYSFTPLMKSVDGTLVHAELDYKNPLIG